MEEVNPGASKANYVPLETVMKEELDSLSSPSSECNIYTIPDRLRHVNQNIFEKDVKKSMSTLTVKKKKDNISERTRGI